MWTIPVVASLVAAAAAELVAAPTPPSSRCLRLWHVGAQDKPFPELRVCPGSAPMPRPEHDDSWLVFTAWVSPEALRAFTRLVEQHGRPLARQERGDTGTYQSEWVEDGRPHVLVVPADGACDFFAALQEVATRARASALDPGLWGIPSRLRCEPPAPPPRCLRLLDVGPRDYPVPELRICPGPAPERAPGPDAWRWPEVYTAWVSPEDLRAFTGLARAHGRPRTPDDALQFGVYEATWSDEEGPHALVISRNDACEFFAAVQAAVRRVRAAALDPGLEGVRAMIPCARPEGR